ncbi:MAG: alpha-galactosidase [Thermoguttaceae bacterium]|jgi:hypothetical protein
MNMIIASFILALGAWTVQFNEDAQLLTLSNADANVEIVGVLTFEADGNQGWRVGVPRDAVDSRLALLDPDGNAQGYLVFNAEGERLEARVYHRTRQFYHGTLSFKGDVTFRDDSFPCRTRSMVGERVLSLATGDANSANFDSLFAREEDLALRFDAARLSISSKGANPPAQYRIEASGRIQEDSESIFIVELDRDYFKKRWVPYYAPIDRKRCPHPPSGWMSWNVYFDKATAEDNLAEARVGKEYLQPFGCEIWSIESWQGNSDSLPVSNFDNLSLKPNENQFPEGMKKLADDIRALGFKPGLWTAPFGTGSDEFYNAHKDWFLHDEQGVAMRTWNGKYTIDPSNDEVVEWLRHIHEIASREWGYEFFKIDGMSGSGPGYCAHFFERPEVRAAFINPEIKAPFERCVKALREGIGDDRIFLACQGHFTGPEAYYADAARTGADIVHPNQPVKWENVLQQAGRTLNQIFVNNIVFFSDPDTLLVRDLPLEEARVTTTIVALPGQQTFFGDFLTKLEPERMKLLQQTLPVCDVRPGALYPYFSNLPIWDLKVARDFEDWDVVALFNWDDDEKEVACTTVELGLDEDKRVAYEFWTNSYLGEIEDELRTTVPAHGVRLVALHKAQDVPQFLSSDRHVTQGAIDLKSCAWRADATTLDATFTLVADNPTVARFLVPDGYVFSNASSPTSAGATIDAFLENEGRILAVRMIGETTCDYDVSIVFHKE